MTLPNLRAKVIVTQLPLLLSVLVVGVVAVFTISDLAAHADLVFDANYRSVVAAQRMKEAAERIDSALLITLAGRTERGAAQTLSHRQRLEAELRVQEGNVTEPGEAAITARLRRAWDEYRTAAEAFLEAPGADRYFEVVEPRFAAVKSAADEVLALNQDAMVHKNEAMRRRAARTSTLLLALSVVMTIGGVMASLALTSRLLRPISVLGLAVRRIATGDLDVQALVAGRDEIATLAADFNAMARKLREYRSSSLGELLQAQAAAQAAIESIPDPVLIFDTGGSVLGTNAAAEAILAEGRGLSDPALAAVVERARSHVGAGKGPYVPPGFEDAVAVPGEGGPRFFLPRASPVHDERGVITGATVILQDVTRLRRFDELKNDLVATVAHEFRTPLTSLRMAIHLCLEGAAGPITEKEADLLHAARGDCERLQSIVDDLLDLARLRSGRFELDLQPVRPAALLAALAEEHRGEAEARGVRIEVDPLPAEAAVKADESRLSIALDNLVSNAIRHSPDGAAVELRAREAGSLVRFEVCDQGPGIPAEHLRSVFERFTRVPGNPTGGAGLGLSIARDIALAHGGDIGVQSEPGRGTTFWLTLPRA